MLVFRAFCFLLTTHKPQPWRDPAVEALPCPTPSVVWILSGTAASPEGVQKTGGTEADHGLCIAAVPLLGNLVSQPLEKRRSRGAGTSSGRENQRCEGAPLHVSNTIFVVAAFVLLVRSVELFQGTVAI